MSEGEYKILLGVQRFFRGEKDFGVVVPVEELSKRFRLATGVNASEIDTKSESERELLENILKFMKDEATNGISTPVGFQKKRFLLATGYNMSFIKTPFQRKNTHSELSIENFKNEQRCTSPDINNAAFPDIKVVVQSSTICAINDIIQLREANTINKLLEVATAKLKFQWSCDVLREIVTEKLGYQIRVTGNKEYILKTRPNLCHESLMKKLMKFDSKPFATTDNLTKSKIRSVIQNNGSRNMTILLKEVRAQLDLDLTSEDLSDIVVKNLGYRIKNNNGIEYLMDNPMIAAGRAKYLRKMRENDQLPAGIKRPVIYVGETIFIPSNINEFWDNKSKRWAIAHAGETNGFVEGADLVYNVKITHSKDQLMDASEFSGWISIELLRKLPINSIIVISNTAAHHCHEENLRPQMSYEKDVMINWLKRNKIEFEQNMTKKELFYLIRTACQLKVYTVDQMLKKFGHEVLRLPPFHDDLNPIEYIWQSLKNRIAERQSFIKNPKDFCLEVLKDLGVNAWKKEIMRVNKIRDMLWEIEMEEENQKLEHLLFDDSYPEFIAHDPFIKLADDPSNELQNRVQIKEELDEDIDIEDHVLGNEVITHKCKDDEDEDMNEELDRPRSNPSVEDRIHFEKELDIDVEQFVLGAKIIRHQCEDEDTDDELAGPSNNSSVENRIQIKEELNEDIDDNVLDAEIIKHQCGHDEDEDTDDELAGSSNDSSAENRIQIKEELNEDNDDNDNVLDAGIIQNQCGNDEDEDTDDELAGSSNDSPVENIIQIKEELIEDIDVDEYVLGTEIIKHYR